MVELRQSLKLRHFSPSIFLSVLILPVSIVITKFPVDQGHFLTHLFCSIKFTPHSAIVCTVSSTVNETADAACVWSVSQLFKSRTEIETNHNVLTDIRSSVEWNSHSWSTPFNFTSCILLQCDQLCSLLKLKCMNACARSTIYSTCAL